MDNQVFWKPPDTAQLRHDAAFACLQQPPREASEGHTATSIDSSIADDVISISDDGCDSDAAPIDTDSIGCARESTVESCFSEPLLSPKTIAASIDVGRHAACELVGVRSIHDSETARNIGLSLLPISSALDQPDEPATTAGDSTAGDSMSSRCASNSPNEAKPFTPATSTLAISTPPPSSVEPREETLDQEMNTICSSRASAVNLCPFPRDLTPETALEDSGFAATASPTASPVSSIATQNSPSGFASWAGEDAAQRAGAIGKESIECSGLEVRLRAHDPQSLRQAEYEAVDRSEIDDGGLDSGSNSGSANECGQGHVLDSREESLHLAVDQEDIDGGSPEDATYCPSSPETDGQVRQHDDSDGSGASCKRRKAGMSRHTRTENMAKFEEWSLQNAVLKRVSMGGVATFQVQFDWDPRLAQNPHRSSVHGGVAPRRQPAVRRAEKRGRASRVGFTQDEDDLLVKLKEGPEALSWACIHRRFSDAFPGRSVSSLQVHYCTKLKVRPRRSLSRHSLSANSEQSA